MRSRTERAWATRVAGRYREQAILAVEEAIRVETASSTKALSEARERITRLQAEVDGLKVEAWKIRELFPNAMAHDFVLRDEVARLLGVEPAPIPGPERVELPEVVIDPLGEEN